MSRSVPVVAIVGATAAGKSDLAVDLAERIGGEIVNTDSMQVYRGMDIGTAKLPVAERRGIPHQLLDFMEIHETASVAVFQRLAREAIEDCRGRGIVPILVGGSALYTRAIVDRIDFPGTDPAVRARLEEQLDELGATVLYQRLQGLDAAAAARIEPGNGRRIVRALEVIEITGGPFVAELPSPAYVLPETVQIGVAIDRPSVDERIEQRVARMWADGLLDEVRALAAQGLAETRTASRAIGYRQALDQLSGELDEAQAQRRTTIATRRFVRRQEAWFVKDERVRWVPYDAPDRVDRALAQITRDR